METVTVKINENGFTCKEVNRLMEPKWHKVEPNENDFCERREYREAESKLREFEIVNCGDIYKDGVDLFYPNKPNIRFANFGSTHQAEVLQNGKVRII